MSLLLIPIVVNVCLPCSAKWKKRFMETPRRLEPTLSGSKYANMILISSYPTDTKRFWTNQHSVKKRGGGKGRISKSGNSLMTPKYFNIVLINIYVKKQMIFFSFCFFTHQLILVPKFIILRKGQQFCQGR